jgi:predicted unusual protein kinase regulating ubiquinone biosynthesis (AarF/ABC1/UbiB family)
MSPDPNTENALRRIDALISVAMRLAGSAPSGRVALAKLAASVEPEWIPQPWGKTIWAELEAARAGALDPISGRNVERVLREAWGAKPTDELDELDLEPVAVTPTSQVHRGVLEGDPVAIKIIRPGLSGSIRQDLALIEGLAAPLGAAFPALDTQAIIREVRERVLDEFDLEHESSTQRRFHRALRGHAFLTVPAPITRLAGNGVLVSEWIDGEPLSRVTDRAVLDRAAAQLLVFVIGGLRAGFVHCDADPEDVLVRSDGRLAILDFGAVGLVEPDRIDTGLALVEAFAAGDASALGTALHGLGLLPAAFGEAAFQLAGDVLGDLGGSAPSRLDSAAIVAAERRLEARPGDVIDLILAGNLPAADLWPARGLAGLFGTIARVGATGAWRELVLGALRDGWDASV